MVTKRKISALNKVLGFVRGPAFLSVMSFVLVVAILPVHAATLLRGYLATDELPAAQSDSQAKPEAASVASGTGNTADSKIQNAGSETKEAAAAKQENSVLERAIVSTDSFPPSFTGAWKCVTVVVDSAVKSVPVGQRVESEVDFVRQKDGRVLAHWEQPGWTEASADVAPVSDREAMMDRTNYYVVETSGAWQAHSHDRYFMVDGNKIAASSQVEQYIDGQFLGRYKTASMLYRIAGNVAYNSSQSTSAWHN